MDAFRDVFFEATRHLQHALEGLRLLVAAWGREAVLAALMYWLWSSSRP